MTEQIALPQHLRTLGFERNPFPQTPDADCYFRTEAIEQQFAEALHCLKAGKGFVLLTGEVGTGKSTFLRRLMDDLAATDCALSFVFNTFLQGRDLLLAINRDFGLSSGLDLADDIDRLNHYLIEQNTLGKCCVVVIDDAQNLDAASLELLRLLSNLETRQNKLLQIMLSGQPELLLLLHQNESRQLASRIVQHIELAALSPDECERYINFRMMRAGSDGRIRLAKAAQKALHRHARGNPRRLHMIMDRCLYGVRPAEQHEIDKQLVDTAARESGIAPIRRASFGKPLALAGLSVGLGLALWLGFGLAPQNVLPQARATAEQAPPVAVAAASAAATAMPVAFQQAVPACLQQLNVKLRWAELEAGTTAPALRATLASLAQNGLALSALPSGVHLAPFASQSASQPCGWSNSTGNWVLWRPAQQPFELAEGARGEPVRWLQRQLAANNLYTAPVDGTVGWRTLAALNVFQHQHGVPANASVDAWTLFLLEHSASLKLQPEHG